MVRTSESGLETPRRREGSSTELPADGGGACSQAGQEAATTHDWSPPGQLAPFILVMSIVLRHAAQEQAQIVNLRKVPFPITSLT